MTIELLIALSLFAFVSSITPGPNNLMLMASGANYGFRRTIPHMLGVGLGFVFMLLLVGLGLINVFNTIPYSYQILKVFSAVYLLYLAFKIAIAKPQQENVDNKAKPFSFLQAAIFQWVNPKAWTMALTAMSIYAPSQSLQSIVIIALVFGVINLPSVGVWTLLGQQIQKLLTSTMRFRLFNIVMALLLVASLFPVLSN